MSTRIAFDSILVKKDRSENCFPRAHFVTLFLLRETLIDKNIFCRIFKYVCIYFLDEVPSRRNSQETVFYHIRRLTTPSILSADVSLKYATAWCWYWQDSFGMWRSFPQNTSEVIETTAVCLSDDIEAKFLAGK